MRYTIYTMSKYFRFLFLAILLGITLVFPVPAFTEDTTPTQTELQNQLSSIEAQIKGLEQQLSATKGQKNTLASQISRLQAEGRALNLKIQSTNLQLKDIGQKIDTTQNSIKLSEDRMKRLNIQLEILIRVLDRSDQHNFLLNLLNAGGLSASFNEAKNFIDLTSQITELTKDVRTTKNKLVADQQALAQQQDSTEQLLTISAAQQSALNGKLTEQKTLLQTTKGLETNYQSQIKDKTKQAQTIRNRLYELVGGNQQINFGQAVTIANWASGQTGVPTPFLLAILTQESNLGKNVGTCNRPNDPPEKSWKVIMKPDRDQEPFKTITEALGKDPDTTPVSCPMRDKKTGKQIGWGGAMGPAQFIPSTWIRYQDKITAITGKSANPWDIRDAFLGAALLLKANGAGASEDSQWKAAMRYFSGSTNTAYRFYGDNVIATAAKYAADIKNLQP